MLLKMELYRARLISDVFVCVCVCLSVVQVASEELIQQARLGQHTRVLSMLQGEAVYPDVTDASRHTPLFAAAVSSACHTHLKKKTARAATNRVIHRGCTYRNPGNFDSKRFPWSLKTTKIKHVECF